MINFICLMVAFGMMVNMLVPFVFGVLIARREAKREAQKHSMSAGIFEVKNAAIITAFVNDNYYNCLSTLSWILLGATVIRPFDAALMNICAVAVSVAMQLAMCYYLRDYMRTGKWTL